MAVAAQSSIVMAGQKREARLLARRPGHPRLLSSSGNTWMPGTSPGMTALQNRSPSAEAKTRPESNPVPPHISVFLAKPGAARYQMRAFSALFADRAVWSAAIAQLVEHVIRNDGVTGSSPVCGTIAQVFRDIGYKRADVKERCG